MYLEVSSTSIQNSPHGLHQHFLEVSNGQLHTMHVASSTLLACNVSHAIVLAGYAVWHSIYSNTCTARSHTRMHAPIHAFPDNWPVVSYRRYRHNERPRGCALACLLQSLLSLQVLAFGLQCLTLSRQQLHSGHGSNRQTDNRQHCDVYIQHISACTGRWDAL